MGKKKRFKTRKIEKILFAILLAIWIILLILIIAKSVNSVDYDYYMNYSSLPFNTTKEVMLTGIENLTINITYGNFTYGVEQLNFLTNTTNLIINISIPKDIEIKNYTDIVMIMGDLDNYTYDTNLSFNFWIYDDTPYPDVEYIEIDINEFEYIVCDYSLPYNTTKEIVVSGVEGQYIQTDFNDRFFSAVDDFTIPAENYSIIDINIHLDNNLTLGSYTEVFRFSIISEYNNITFHFNIIDCILPVVACIELYNDMNDACTKLNMTPSEVLDCKKKTLDYDKCIYDAMLDASESIIVNHTITEYVNRTEYQPVVPVGEGLAKALEEFYLTWRQMITESRNMQKALDSRDDEILQLKDEKSKVWEEANKRAMESLEGMVEENRLKQNTIDELEDKYFKKSTLYWLLFFVVLGGLCVWLYFLIKDNTYY